jgi:hypothetical protein
MEGDPTLKPSKRSINTNFTNESVPTIDGMTLFSKYKES